MSPPRARERAAAGPPGPPRPAPGGEAAPAWTVQGVLLPVLATTVVLAFLSGKALHIDDPLFVWCAKWIAHHPLDPFGLTVNWYGVEAPFSKITKNPPLAAYALALAGGVLGWSERALHLAFLVPAAVVVAGSGLLARRLGASPSIAAAACCASPIFLVSGTTLMCDTMMLALWVAAVGLWWTGLERRRGSLLLLSALLVSLAVMTKYFAIALVPLLAVSTLLRRGAPRRAWLPLLLPPLLLAAWHFAGERLYGQSPVLDAASYAPAAGEAGGAAWVRLIVALAFAGGGVVVVFFALPWLWSRRAALVWALVVGLCAGAGFLAARGGTLQRSGCGPSTGLFGVQLGLLGAAGIHLVALAVSDLRRARDAGAWLVFLWIAGTLVFAARVNWSTNARSVLPLAPAAGILLARRLGAGHGAALRSRAALPIAASAILAILAAHADASLADASRRAAATLHERYSTPNAQVWFEGHWGFQYYMQEWGARPVDYRSSRMEVGSRLMIPVNNTNLRPLPPDRIRLLDVVSISVDPFVATMSRETGAGFYMDGPLPFAVGAVPAEEFAVYEIR